MEKRIALEKRGRPDNQITELILDNCRSTNIDGLTDSFTALEVLSLNNVGLVSLKNFPKLPSLRKLELSDNRISSGLNNLVNSQKLTHINLSGNKIKDYEELQPLKELENLTVLDLFNNEVTTQENFRDKMFELIPSLKYLDGFDKQEVEAPSEDEDLNGNADDDEDETAEDSDTSDYDDEDEDGNDVSLAEVYNDDLEEDNSDWNVEGAEEEDDEDADDPSDDEGGEKAEEEPEEGARGKKRKHDG